MPNIVYEVKLDFKDVLLRPKRSTLKSRADVDLFREITFRNSKQTYKGIPLIASNMDTVGTFEMAKALSKHGLMTAVHKYYQPEDWQAFAESSPEALCNVAASCGLSETDLARLNQVLDLVPAIRFICLDVANGYSQQFVEHVRKVRELYPQHIIIAGNVVTGEMVEELVLSGADIIKVGIGPGSVCTTRIKTGVGYPQLSAVLECADSAHGLSAHIISDGGCTSPGDVAKAFGAGADFVMLGDIAKNLNGSISLCRTLREKEGNTMSITEENISAVKKMLDEDQRVTYINRWRRPYHHGEGMLAGHDQSGGEIRHKPDGRTVKLFYGMSSDTAMIKHQGEVAQYRCAEGKTVEVDYRGDVEGTVLDILGGLRSACTYTGAGHLKEISKRATFIRCTQQANTVFRS